MTDLNLEENRLQTFHAWPSNAPIPPDRLARGGFFATGNFLETQCNWCSKKISDWQYGDQTMVRHRQLDPLCPFVVNPTNSGNVPLTSSSSSAEGSLDQVAPQFDPKNEICRLATFKNWPNPNISPQSLAKAGFYYFNKLDQVQCAWCGGIIEKWENGDNAFEEHQRYFPNCPRVQLGPLIEIASDGMRDLGIQQIRAPKKPKYSSLDARVRTYAQWPRSDIQKPEVLAEAGFYYHDIDDHVRCFHCNGGLRSWQKEDDPWAEHAKWFPNCQFVQLVKGQAYINHVQEFGHSTQGVSSENRVTQTMTLEEAMLSEPVRMALQMGLNEGRIRNSTKLHLETYGMAYENAEELIANVLDNQVNEDDDDNSEQSSTIVREVSRILNNIFTGVPESELLGSESPIENPDESFNYEEPSFSLLTSNSSVCHSASPPLDRVSQSPTSSQIQKPNSMTPGPSSSTTEVSKQLLLEEENRKLKDARLCKVCMDDEVGIVFLPCGHLVTCVQCAPGVTTCPLCRSAIKGFVRTFLS